MDDVEKLIRDLKSEDANVRWRAAEVLGRIGLAFLRSKAPQQSQNYLEFCNTVVPALVEALGDENVNMRWRAADALRKIGDASAVPALVKTLGDGNAGVRWSAADALGNIGKPAIPALVKALGDMPWAWRYDTTRALGEIVDKCETIEALESLEGGVKESFATLRKSHPDQNELIEVKMTLADLMKKVSEKKNELAPKRDMLLSDKPKPPKGGKMYQATRRVRNG